MVAALNDAFSAETEAEAEASALADAALADAAFADATAELVEEAALRASPHPGSAKAATPSIAVPVRLKKERLVNMV